MTGWVDVNKKKEERRKWERRKKDRTKRREVDQK